MDNTVHICIVLFWKTFMNCWCLL